jgi:hypothetical protein
MKTINNKIMRVLEALAKTILIVLTLGIFWAYSK